MEEQAPEILKAQSDVPQLSTSPNIVYIERPVTIGYIIDNIDTKQLVSWIGIVLMIFFTLFTVWYIVWTGNVASQNVY